MTQRIRMSAVACGLLLAVIATAANAVAPQRTFVSSGGNDVNACSLAFPCRGFAAAVTAVAAKGEVIVLDSAGYGPVTITKSVSLIAPAGIYAGVTVSAGDGITVNAPGGVVILRGLSINGQGGNNGINLQQAARLRIEGCVVSSMGVDGIIHSAEGAELIVLDTIVRDNGGSGIGGDANAFVVLDHVRSEHNGTNGFYLASFSAEASATITDSVFAFNGSNGLWVASTGTGYTRAQVDRSVMSNNGAAGIRISGAGSEGLNAGVTRNSIHRNGGGGVAVFGPQFVLATVSENTINHNLGNGVSGDGSFTHVSVSANSLTLNTVADLSQSNAAQVGSYSDNIGHFYVDSGTVTPEVKH